jgi:hypothetical protein
MMTKRAKHWLNYYISYYFVLGSGSVGSQLSKALIGEHDPVISHNIPKHNVHHVE